MAPIRVQLVTDDQMLADALSRRLAREAEGFLVRHSPAAPDTSLASVAAFAADVLVVDAASVPGPWSAVVDAVTDVVPDVRVVVLADTADAEDAVEAALRCVAAWLPPSVSAEELIGVLRVVAGGHAVYPSAVLGVVLRRLVHGLPHRRGPSGPLASLTEREREVLVCLVEGRHGPEIAEHLDIAANTVRSHTSRILRKLGAHTRLEAVRIARENGVEPRSTARVAVAPNVALTNPSSGR